MRFVEKLGALSHRARQAIILHTVYTLTETIGEVFFSIYLWRLTNSLALVAQYNFWLWAVFTVSFIGIGYLFKGKGISHLYRFSFLWQFLFYGIVVYLGATAVNWAGYLGALFGLGSAFYWAASEVMMLSGTNDKNREMFLGVMMSGEHIARIAGPALAAVLIGWRGYSWLFAVMAVFFLLAELIIKQIREVSFQQFSLTGMLQLYNRKAWRWNLWRSFCDGLMISRWFVWSILSYLILKSEVWLGTMMSLVGVLGIASNILIGHWFKPKLRDKLNLWGTILLVSAGILYPLLLNQWGLLIDQGLGEMVGAPLFTFAWFAWFYLAVETDNAGEKRQFEYYAGHELWQGVGRVLSIGIFWLLAVKFEQIGLARWWFGGLSLIFIVQWWLVKKVRRALIKAGYKEN